MSKCASCKYEQIEGTCPPCDDDFSGFEPVISKLKWVNSEDFKHSPFQAFWDHGFNFKEDNSKLQNNQSFQAAWDCQQKKIEKLKRCIELYSHIEEVVNTGHELIELNEHAKQCLNEIN